MSSTPTGTDTQSTGSGLHDAANAFGQLLSLEEEGTQGEAEANPEAEGEENAEAQAEANPESQAEGTEEPAEEAAAEEESTEGEEQDEQPQDQAFTVRIDGKEEQVTESELIAGYSRQADYTRKTQALANERAAFKQQEESVRQERSEYATLLPKLRAALEEGLGEEPNWEQLRTENPQEAVLEWQRRQDKARKIQAAKQEEARLQGIAEQERQAEINRIFIEQKDLLQKALPQWNSNKKLAGEEAALIEKTLRNHGFDGEELNIHDHRVLLVARKAALYDKLMESQQGLQKKKSVAPVLKPGAKKPAKSVAERDAARFNKSGRVKDAVPLFRNFID